MAEPSQFGDAGQAHNEKPPEPAASGDSGPATPSPDGGASAGPTAEAPEPGKQQEGQERVGHKYKRREPLPGGGFRYFYDDEGDGHDDTHWEEPEAKVSFAASGIDKMLPGLPLVDQQKLHAKVFGDKSLTPEQKTEALHALLDVPAEPPSEPANKTKPNPSSANTMTNPGGTPAAEPGTGAAGTAQVPQVPTANDGGQSAMEALASGADTSFDFGDEPDASFDFGDTPDESNAPDESDVPEEPDSGFDFGEAPTAPTAPTAPPTDQEDAPFDFGGDDGWDTFDSGDPDTATEDIDPQPTGVPVADRLESYIREAGRKNNIINKERWSQTLRDIGFEVPAEYQDTGDLVELSKRAQQLLQWQEKAKQEGKDATWAEAQWREQDSKKPADPQDKLAAMAEAAKVRYQEAIDKAAKKAAVPAATEPDEETLTGNDSQARDPVMAAAAAQGVEARQLLHIASENEVRRRLKTATDHDQKHRELSAKIGDLSDLLKKEPLNLKAANEKADLVRQRNARRRELEQPLWKEVGDELLAEGWEPPLSDRSASLKAAAEGIRNAEAPGEGGSKAVQGMRDYAKQWEQENRDRAAAYAAKVQEREQAKAQQKQQEQRQYYRTIEDVAADFKPGMGETLAEMALRAPEAIAAIQERTKSAFNRFKQAVSGGQQQAYGPSKAPAINEDWNAWWDTEMGAASPVVRADAEPEGWEEIRAGWEQTQKDWGTRQTPVELAKAWNDIIQAKPLSTDEEKQALWDEFAQQVQANSKAAGGQPPADVVQTPAGTSATSAVGAQPVVPATTASTAPEQQATGQTQTPEQWADSVFAKDPAEPTLEQVAGDTTPAQPGSEVDMEPEQELTIPPRPDAATAPTLEQIAGNTAPAAGAKQPEAAQTDLGSPEFQASAKRRQEQLAQAASAYQQDEGAGETPEDTPPVPDPALTANTAPVEPTLEGVAAGGAAPEPEENTTPVDPVTAMAADAPPVEPGPDTAVQSDAPAEPASAEGQVLPKGVQDKASVTGDARMLENARASGSAKVSGGAVLSGNAHVYDNASVRKNALVTDNAQVYGNAVVHDFASVKGDAQVGESAQVFRATVAGNAFVHGNARVTGDDAVVAGNAEVAGDAKVTGNSRIDGDAVLLGGVWHNQKVSTGRWLAPGVPAPPEDTAPAEPKQLTLEDIASDAEEMRGAATDAPAKPSRAELRARLDQLLEQEDEEVPDAGGDGEDDTPPTYAPPEGSNWWEDAALHRDLSDDPHGIAETAAALKEFKSKIDQEKKDLPRGKLKSVAGLSERLAKKAILQHLQEKGFAPRVEDVSGYVEEAMSTLGVEEADEEDDESEGIIVSDVEEKLSNKLTSWLSDLTDELPYNVKDFTESGEVTDRSASHARSTEIESLRAQLDAMDAEDEDGEDAEDDAPLVDTRTPEQKAREEAYRASPAYAEKKAAETARLQAFRDKVNGKAPGAPAAAPDVAAQMRDAATDTAPTTDAAPDDGEEDMEAKWDEDGVYTEGYEVARDDRLLAYMAGPDKEKQQELKEKYSALTDKARKHSKEMADKIAKFPPVTEKNHLDYLTLVANKQIADDVANYNHLGHYVITDALEDEFDKEHPALYANGGTMEGTDWVEAFSPLVAKAKNSWLKDLDGPMRAFVEDGSVSRAGAEKPTDAEAVGEPPTKNEKLQAALKGLNVAPSRGSKYRQVTLPGEEVLSADGKPLFQARFNEAGDLEVRGAADRDYKKLKTEDAEKYLQNAKALQDKVKDIPDHPAAENIKKAYQKLLLPNKAAGEAVTADDLAEGLDGDTGRMMRAIGAMAPEDQKSALDGLTQRLAKGESPGLDGYAAVQVSKKQEIIDQARKMAQQHSNKKGQVTLPGHFLELVNEQWKDNPGSEVLSSIRHSLMQNKTSRLGDKQLVNHGDRQATLTLLANTLQADVHRLLAEDGAESAEALAYRQKEREETKTTPTEREQRFDDELAAGKREKQELEDSRRARLEEEAENSELTVDAMAQDAPEGDWDAVYDESKAPTGPADDSDWFAQDDGDSSEESAPEPQRVPAAPGAFDALLNDKTLSADEKWERMQALAQQFTDAPAPSAPTDETVQAAAANLTQQDNPNIPNDEEPLADMGAVSQLHHETDGATPAEAKQETVDTVGEKAADQGAAQVDEIKAMAAAAPATETPVTEAPKKETWRELNKQLAELDKRHVPEPTAQYQAPADGSWWDDAKLHQHLSPAADDIPDTVRELQKLKKKVTKEAAALAAEGVPEKPKDKALQVVKQQVLKDIQSQGHSPLLLDSSEARDAVTDLIDQAFRAMGVKELDAGEDLDDIRDSVRGRVGRWAAKLTGDEDLQKLLLENEITDRTASHAHNKKVADLTARAAAAKTEEAAAEAERMRQAEAEWDRQEAEREEQNKARDAEYVAATQPDPLQAMADEAPVANTQPTPEPVPTDAPAEPATGTPAAAEPDPLQAVADEAPVVQETPDVAAPNKEEALRAVRHSKKDSWSAAHKQLVDQASAAGVSAEELSAAHADKEYADAAQIDGEYWDELKDTEEGKAFVAAMKALEEPSGFNDDDVVKAAREAKEAVRAARSGVSEQVKAKRAGGASAEMPEAPTKPYASNSEMVERLQGLAEQQRAAAQAGAPAQPQAADPLAALAAGATTLATEEPAGPAGAASVDPLKALADEAPVVPETPNAPAGEAPAKDPLAELAASAQTGSSYSSISDIMRDNRLTRAQKDEQVASFVRQREAGQLQTMRANTPATTKALAEGKPFAVVTRNKGLEEEQYFSNLDDANNALRKHKAVGRSGQVYNIVAPEGVAPGAATARSAAPKTKAADDFSEVHTQLTAALKGASKEQADAILKEARKAGVPADVRTEASKQWRTEREAADIESIEDDGVRDVVKQTLAREDLHPAVAGALRHLAGDTATAEGLQNVLKPLALNAAESKELDVPAIVAEKTKSGRLQALAAGIRRLSEKFSGFAKKAAEWGMVAVMALGITGGLTAVAPDLQAGQERYLDRKMAERAAASKQQAQAAPLAAPAQEADSQAPAEDPLAAMAQEADETERARQDDVESALDAMAKDWGEDLLEKAKKSPAATHILSIVRKQPLDHVMADSLPVPDKINTGSAVADNALKLVKKHQGKVSFDMSRSTDKEVPRDCSSFGAKAVGMAKMPGDRKDDGPFWRGKTVSSESIYTDAKKHKERFSEVSPQDAKAGDLLVYPDYTEDGEKHDGHVMVVIDPNDMTMADMSESNDGMTYRPGRWEAVADQPNAIFVRYKGKTKELPE